MVEPESSPALNDNQPLQSRTTYLLNNQPNATSPTPSTQYQSITPPSKIPRPKQAHTKKDSVPPESPDSPFFLPPSADPDLPTTPTPIPTPNYINLLPTEILLNIFSYNPHDFYPVSSNATNPSHVCPHWRHVYEPLLYRHLKFMQHKQTGGSQNVRLFLLATKLRPGIKWYPQTVEFYLGNEGEIGQRKMKPRTDLQYLAQDKKAIEKFVEVLKLCLGIQSIRTNVCIDKGSLYQVLPKLLNLRTLEARFDSPRIPIAALKLPYLKTLIFHYMDDEWTQAVGSTHRDSDDSPSPKRRTETPWRWARTGAITTLRLYIDADLPVLYEKIFIWPIALSHLSIHGGSTPYGYDKAALERILNPHRDTLQTIELPDICNGLPDLSTFKRLTHLTFPAWRFITLDDSSKPSTRPSKPSKEPTPSPSTLLPSSLKILTLPFPSHCYQSPPRYVQNPPAFTAETSDWFIAFAETRQETSSDARYKIILNYDVFRGRAYVSRSDKRKVIGWPWTQLERAKEGAREFGVELEFEASISKAEWFEMGMAKDIWESNGLELGRLFLGEE